MKKRIIVIFSGGMDSTTLVYDLINQGHKVQCLSFNYGQRHKKELEYAAKTCEKLNLKHFIIDLTNITSLISNSSLTGNIEVPEGHYEDESMKKTVVPNRNMIMLSIAIGYAENLGYDCVAIANHAGDHAIYPDCRTEFINALNKTAILGTYNKIYIYAPYSNITKIDIAKKGLDLGINYDKEAWSCYKGLDEQCGVCGTCCERLEAIKLAKESLKVD